MDNNGGKKLLALGRERQKKSLGNDDYDYTQDLLVASEKCQRVTGRCQWERLMTRSDTCDEREETEPSSP